MTRDELDTLLEFCGELQSDLDAIKSNIYSTDEPYGDDVLAALMSLEKVADGLINTVKYLDEQLLLKEIDTGEEE